MLQILPGYSEGGKLVHCFYTKVVDPDPKELASVLSTCTFHLGLQCQLSNAAEMQGLSSQILPISRFLLQVGMQQPLQASLKWLQALGQCWQQSLSVVQMMKVLRSDSLTAFQ